MCIDCRREGVEWSRPGKGKKGDGSRMGRERWMEKRDGGSDGDDEVCGHEQLYSVTLRTVNGSALQSRMAET